MEAENFSSGKVEAGGEDKALGRDRTQHQLIKLAGEKEEERVEEKGEHILVKVLMQYHMQYVNLSMLSTSTAT